MWARVMKSVRENTTSSGASSAGAAEHVPEEAAPEWAYEIAHGEGAADLAPVVGRNLRKLRTQRGLSLERLSKASGVSRAMLGQVELGQSAPTINVLWKIARALGIPFSALITSTGTSGTKVLRSAQ